MYAREVLAMKTDLAEDRIQVSVKFCLSRAGIKNRPKIILY